MSCMHPGAWEYRTGTDLGVDKLNELGSQGWELVSVENQTFYLKRPGPSFRDRVTLDQKRHYCVQVETGASQASAKS